MNKDPNSGFWIGTENGLFQLSKSSKEIYAMGEAHALSRSRVNIIRQIDNKLWVGTDQGLYARGEELEFFDRYEGLANSNIIEIFSINRSVWILTNNSGLYEYAEGNIIGHYDFPEIRLSTCMSLMEDSKLWIGTESGRVIIYDVNNGEKKILNSNDGLPPKKIVSMCPDLFGNVWVSTDDELIKITKGQFLKYGTKDGIPSGQVEDFLTITDSLYLLHESGGLLQFTDGIITELFGDSIYQNSTMNCLTNDASGNIWIGSEDSGVLRYSDGRIYHYNNIPGSVSNHINDIATDSLGFVWVATRDKGIFQIERADSILSPGYIISTREGLPDMNILKIEVDRNNRIWFASGSGEVGYIQDGKVVAVFRLNRNVRNVGINSFVFDRHGYVLVGTAGDGLYIAHSNQNELAFRSLELLKPLRSSNVLFVNIDSKNVLWVVTTRGIELIQLNQSGEVQSQYFLGKNQGYDVIDYNASSAALDKKDNAWIGLDGEVFQFQTEYKLESSEPILQIEKMEILFEPIEFNYTLDSNYFSSSKLMLGKGNDDIGFYLKAIDINHPDDIEYRWRLGDGAAKWSWYTEQNSIHLANLKPGSYIFQAQARSTVNNQSRIATVRFDIEGPLWNKTWFKFLLAAILVLITYIIWLSRIKYVRGSESRKRAELEMRNDLLQLEQKAMQLQMNPHFIFNSLNSIQSLIVAGQEKAARKQISKFATLMRSLLNNSRTEYVDLEDELNLLTNYIEFEQFCKPDSFEYEIKLDEQIQLNNIEIPPMLIQPFVENSINHGFASLNNRKGKLLISLVNEGRMLKCVVKDNGVGIKNSKASKKYSSHKSSAIEITRKRLEALSKNKNETVIKINDVIDDKGDVRGTEVVLLIQYRSKF
jgi:ligand-binding sensor domain-containing protein/two-component sensor histidine kinase